MSFSLPATRRLLTASCRPLPALTRRFAVSPLKLNRGFQPTSTAKIPTPAPSQSPPLLGTEAALKYAQDPQNAEKPTIKLFDEFSQKGRIGVITGGASGLGLEMCLALCEAGGTVYALDLPTETPPDLIAVQTYVSELNNGSSLQYRQVNVTDRSQMFSVIDSIADAHGRLDVTACVAGVLGIVEGEDCWKWPEDAWKKVLDVNTNGVFFTAQAAASNMMKYKDAADGGSIIMLASMSGTIVNKDMRWVAYNTSKSAVLQMARSMACELGKHKIRVNSISPGHIDTKMVRVLMDKDETIEPKWAGANPMGRVGKSSELRGVTAWLASSASTYVNGSDILVDGGHVTW